MTHLINPALERMNSQTEELTAESCTEEGLSPLSEVWIAHICAGISKACLQFKEMSCSSSKCSQRIFWPAVGNFLHRIIQSHINLLAARNMNNLLTYKLEKLLHKNIRAIFLFCGVPYPSLSCPSYFFFSSVKTECMYRKLLLSKTQVTSS